MYRAKRRGPKGFRKRPTELPDSGTHNGWKPGTHQLAHQFHEGRARHCAHWVAQFQCRVSLVGASSVPLGRSKLAFINETVSNNQRIRGTP